MRTFLIQLRNAMLAMLCAQTAFTAGFAIAQPVSYQGLWWNAPAGSESGWGINLAHQGDVIFATWFTYDTTGKGWWLSMTANKTADRTYAGVVIETAGPPIGAASFDPALVTRTPVGTGTLTFSDADTGTFAYYVRNVQQTKAITRQVYGRLPTCAYATQPNFAAATNYQDLWWVPAGTESGWGVNLTHQSDSIFATWFTYDADGTPMWLSMTADKVAAGIYRGDVIRTEGPAFNAVPFNPALVKRTVVGSATLSFSHGNAASLDYTFDGITRTKSLTRQLFAPPAGTLCAPTRLIKNSFDSDNEGWFALGDGGFSWKDKNSEYSHPTYGAHLEAIDGALSPWYFGASRANYRGDISSFYGGELTYQLRWRAATVSDCRLRGKHDYYYQDWWKPDVMMQGHNGLLLGYFSPDPPDRYAGGLYYYDVWTTVRVPITEQYGTVGDYKFGWIKFCENRPTCYVGATRDEILSVLKDVADVRIRGEYCLGSHDRGMLDEVTLTAP